MTLTIVQMLMPRNMVEGVLRHGGNIKSNKCYAKSNLVRFGCRKGMWSDIVTKLSRGVVPKDLRLIFFIVISFNVNSHLD